MVPPNLRPWETKGWKTTWDVKLSILRSGRLKDVRYSYSLWALPGLWTPDDHCRLHVFMAKNCVGTLDFHFCARQSQCRSDSWHVECEPCRNSWVPGADSWSAHVLPVLYWQSVLMQLCGHLPSLLSWNYVHIHISNLRILQQEEGWWQCSVMDHENSSSGRIQEYIVFVSAMK